MTAGRSWVAPSADLTPGDAPRQAPRGVLGSVYRRTPGLLTMVPLLLLWELVGRMELFWVLPPLSSVLEAGWELIVSGRIAESGAGTLRALLIGLAISMLGGTVLGVLIGYYRLMDEVLGPYLDVMMSAPVSAMVPILVLVFGTGSESIVVTVVLFSIFVITVNTQAGVKEVDHQLTEMARSVGCRGWMLFRKVILPGALPLMLAGFRMGIGRSFNGAVFGEMLISVVGLGGLLMTFGSRFMFENLDALILMIIGVAVVMMGFFEWLEVRMLRHR